LDKLDKLDTNDVAALLEALCERPFEGDQEGQPLTVQAIASRAAQALSRADEVQSVSGAGQAGNPGQVTVELASILSGTATDAQCHAFQEAAAASGAVRLEAQSALAFVDGIEQAPLAAPAYLVEQVLASAGSAPSEHFQEKWNPVFRPKMRQRQNAGAASVSGQYETALASPGIWSRLRGSLLGERRGQVAAACAVMLMAGGLSWSLLWRPTGLGLDGPAAPVATSPAEGPPISGTGLNPAPAPALVPEPTSAPAEPVLAPAPKPVLAPAPASAPMQALADPCEPRSLATSETGARSKDESKAAKAAANRQPKTAAVPAPDPGCAVNGGAIEAGRNPQADQGPVRADRPAARIGRTDRDPPKAAASAPASAPAGVARPASPALRPGPIEQRR
jgi:hypothetical protein